MYNRYVPQADGSYRRNRMEEQRQVQRPKTPPNQYQHQQSQPPLCPPEDRCEEPKHRNQNVGGFLKQLLPKDFDTADLIIVLLLLLLAGDCEENKATAMLTMVLYLFL